MANKPLKSIKFPGLDDVYTVPQVDDTLTMAGEAADAKKTGDEVASLKSAFNIVDAVEYVLPATSIIQGSYSNNSTAPGKWVDNSKRIRNEGFIRVIPGYGFHFVPGENASELLWGRFANGSLIADSQWITTETDVEIPNGVDEIVLVFRNNTNTDILPSEYDATITISTKISEAIKDVDAKANAVATNLSESDSRFNKIAEVDINIFNKNDADIEDGYYLKTNGTKGTLSTGFITGYMPCVYGDVIVSNNSNGDYGVHDSLYIYDKLKNYLGRAVFNRVDETSTRQGTINQKNAKYFRINQRKNNKDTLMVCKNIAMPNNYYPYGYAKVKESALPDINADGTVTINIASSDKIGFFSNSFLNGYTMRGHHAIENISMFSDYIMYNYGRSGANMVSRWKSVNSNETWLGSVPVKSWGIKYGVIAMEDNDVGMYNAEKESYYENTKKLAEAVKALGAIPILGTEHDNSRLYYAMTALAEKYGYMFMDWGKMANAMVCGKFPPFWASAHPATRTAWLWSNGMKKYLDTLPRPEQSIKLFRVRSFIDTTDLDNLLYNDNGQRAERFAEVHCGQNALTSATEKYFDRMGTGNASFEDVYDEYQKIQSGSASLSMGNYALIECVTPFANGNVNTLKINVSATGVTKAYIKKNLDITIPYSEATYICFGVTQGAELLTVGSTFTVTGGVFSDTLLATYTVNMVENGIVYTNTSASGKTTSGTDNPVINVTGVTLAGSYKAPSESYLNNFKKPFGAWTEITGFNSDGETDLSDYVSKWMDYDKVSILLEGSSISLSDVTFTVNGNKKKVEETYKDLVEWKKGTAIITDNLLDDNTAWENINTIDKYTPVQSTTSSVTEGKPSGVTTIRILHEGQTLTQALTTTALNQNAYANDLLQVRVLARYFPTYIDTDAKWAASEVTEDSFDCAKVGFKIGDNGKCYSAYVGAYWNVYIFNVSYISGSDITVMALGKDIQIGRVDVDLL